MTCKLSDNKTNLASGHFLVLDVLEYQTSDGATHKWEAVSRKNTSGAVMLIPELIPSGRVVVIRQFRPPAATYVWEFPAGLVEKGEDPAVTAVRELYEETGYHGVVTKCSPPVYSSPGLTSETVQIVNMTIEEAGQENPEPHFDGAEEIETFAVEQEQLYSFLMDAVAKGDVVDSKLYTFAMLKNQE